MILGCVFLFVPFFESSLLLSFWVSLLLSLFGKKEFRFGIGLAGKEMPWEKKGQWHGRLDGAFGYWTVGKVALIMILDKIPWGHLP